MKTEEEKLRRARARRKELAARDPELSERLARYAHYDYRRLDLELYLLERIYAKSKNPVAALRALEICLEESRPLDEWPERVKTYLHGSVARLLALKPKPKAIREWKSKEGKTRKARTVRVLRGDDALKALGFAGEKRKNRLDEYHDTLSDLRLFFKIEDRIIAERGAADARGIQGEMIRPIARKYAESKAEHEISGLEMSQSQLKELKEKFLNDFMRRREREIAERFREWRKALYRKFE